jgi:hypothetical protein
MTASASMIPPAAERFLREHTRTFLVTVRPDGAPTCHPMVGLYREGVLYLNTYRKSAKARNMMLAPHVACVVVTDDDDPHFRGVVVRGRAEVAPADALRTAPDREGAGSPPGVGREVVGLVQARLAEGKRILVRVLPEEVRLVGQHA